MLDKWTIQLVKQPLISGAKLLHSKRVSADSVSLFGFLVGMLAIPLLFFQLYYLALIAIVFNRICDGLDGALARLSTPTDRGAFLDISLDFVFYSGVVFGFILADPSSNGLAGSALIFSFVGTGSSFLAFAIMAEKRKLKSNSMVNKGFYYINGLAEGTETIIILILFCLFPSYFAEIAYVFATICFITTASRIISGYQRLNENSADNSIE